MPDENGFCGFQVFEDFFSTPHDAQGHTCQFGNVYPVTSTETARGYAMKKDDLTLFIVANCHCIDTQPRKFVRHKCQFVIMCGKKCAGCRHVMQVLHNCS